MEHLLQEQLLQKSKFSIFHNISNAWYISKVLKGIIME